MTGKQTQRLDGFLSVETETVVIPRSSALMVVLDSPEDEPLAADTRTGAPLTTQAQNLASEQDRRYLFLTGPLHVLTARQ
jgi:hypothetical protein